MMMVALMMEVIIIGIEGDINMKTVTHNGHLCKITQVWDYGYYDLVTIEPTEKGIIETYLSVHRTELLREGNENV